MASDFYIKIWHDDKGRMLVSPDLLFHAPEGQEYIVERKTADGWDSFGGMGVVDLAQARAQAMQWNMAQEEPCRVSKVSRYAVVYPGSAYGRLVIHSVVIYFSRQGVS